jgi:hypothetical protein
VGHGMGEVRKALLYSRDPSFWYLQEVVVKVGSLQQ